MFNFNKDKDKDKDKDDKEECYCHNCDDDTLHDKVYWSDHPRRFFYE